MTERRTPPPKPPKLGPPMKPMGLDQSTDTLWGWAIETGRNLDTLWRYAGRHSYDSIPAPHTHAPGSGGGPISGAANEDVEVLALAALLEAD